MSEENKRPDVWPPPDEGPRPVSCIEIKRGQKWEHKYLSGTFTVYRITSEPGVYDCRGLYFMRLNSNNTILYFNDWIFKGWDSEFNPCHDCGFICKQGCRK